MNSLKGSNTMKTFKIEKRLENFKNNPSKENAKAFE